jgi:GAF domain-containing protein/HAMP domain-containing protein
MAVNNAQKQSRIANQISSTALRDQAEEYLVNLTLASARENDLTLEKVNLDAQKVAGYIATLYDNKEILLKDPYWQAANHMSTRPDGQYANPADDLSSVYVPNFQEVDVDVTQDIELSGYLDLLFASIFDRNPNIEAIYYATPRNVVRYYPNVDLGTVLPPDFKATERVWYAGSTPENNPESLAWWTPVYIDATGLGLVTTAAAPVYSSLGEFIGVVGFDVTLDEMRASIEKSKPLMGGYSFLVDKAGIAIALPSQAYQNLLGRAPLPDEVGADLSSSTTEFAPVIINMMAGESGFTSVFIDREEYFVAYSPLISTGWSLGNVVRADDVLAAVGELQSELENTSRTLVLNRIMPVSVMLFLIISILGLFLTNRLVNPIPRLAEAAQRLGAGQWDVKMPRMGKDEIGSLAQSFSSMAIQLRGLVTGLEQRVAERTAELERRAVQLQTAAIVSREAAAIRDLRQLLQQVCGLISERFGFYHVGIFLLDEEGEYAILQAANSEGGKRMLAKEHKLRVGQVGIVGHVAGSGEPRIAMNVGADATFFNNPDLPNTHSEIALPLRVHGRVIGVLDVQSTHIAAIKDEDVEILQIMADQVALAIENARLFQASQSAYHDLQSQYAQETRRVWMRRLGGQPLAYIYNRLGVEPISSTDVIKEWNLLDVQDPTTSNNSLVVPVTIRNQKIGTIALRREPGQEPWSRDDQALVEDAVVQIAQALENALLMEENQLRAQQERLIGQITAKAQSSLDLETIMKTAVREIGLATNAARVQIRLGINESPKSPPGNGDPE